MLVADSRVWSEIRRKPLEDFNLVRQLRSTRPDSLTPGALKALQFSILRSKYSIFYDAKNSPVGYAAWADIDIEMLLRMNRVGVLPKYIYEWDEGGIRFFFDVCIRTPTAENIAELLTSKLCVGFEFVAFYRRGKLKFYGRLDGRMRRRSIDDLILESETI